MPKSFQEWISEGESLYEAAINEFRAMETQLEELEARLSGKQAEVNQIAQVIGKPPVESNRKVAAQIMEANTAPSGAPSIIARALSGRQINR